MNKDKKARARSYEDILHRLEKLVNESQSFGDFQKKLTSFRGFYMGNPVPEELIRWTWVEFEKFYNEVKGIIK